MIFKMQVMIRSDNMRGCVSLLRFTVFVISCIMAQSSSCPLNPMCHCNFLSIRWHCNNLSAIPDNLPDKTVSLTIQYGHITVIETSKLQHLTKLTVLRIIHNNVSVIEDGALDNTSLHHLSFWSNNIHSLQQGVFSSLTTLKELVLTDNFLKSLDGVLDGLDLLELLSADNNQITHLSPHTFHHMKNLHHLKLHQNKIMSIAENTFLNNKFFTYLSLGSNPIGDIGPILSPDTRIHFINLTDCQLTKFPANLPHTLQIIRISKNNIKTIHKKDLTIYKHLSAIILDENKLSYIEHGTFTHLKGLKELYLFVNELETIPGPFPNSVKNLYLDNNKIKSIPSGSFTEGTKLSLLSLRNNRITSMDKDSFQRVESVEKLHLEANSISELENGMFSQVKMLKILSLNRLKLSTIQKDCFAGLSHLQTLEMAFVKVPMADIEGNFFTDTPDLQVLDIHNSPTLAHFILSSMDIIKSLSNLKEINLMETKLTTLHSDFERLFPMLTKINLAQNPFHCTSDLLWLKILYGLQPQKFTKFNQVRCHMPRQVQGQRISQLDFSSLDKPENGSDFFTSDMEGTTESYEYYKYEYEYVTDEDYYIDQVDSVENKTTVNSINNIDTFDIETTENYKSTTIPNMSNVNNDISARSVGIAIGMALAVVLVMLLIAACLYMCWKTRRDHRNSNEYHGKEDYVFIMSKTDIKSEADTQPPRMTRDQRGSTTSHASEDITNQTDLSMKVYTLEVDN